MFTRPAPTRRPAVALTMPGLAFISGMTSGPVAALTCTDRGLSRRTLVHAAPLRIVLTDDPADIAAAQRFRFEVFAAEPGFSDDIGDAESRRDADHFDDHCEHLLARHDEHGIIGCARLLPPPRAIAAGGWYSSTEFDLTALDEIASMTVEMGRACVATGHRDGSVTALMWASILRYLQESGYRYLMGSVSMPLGGPAIDGAARGSALRGARDELNERYPARWRVHPHESPRVDGVALDDIPAPDRVVLPPLMRAYLRLGARVCGDPAVDPAFDVGDFPTVLDLECANLRYLDRLRDTVLRLGGAA
ncbi:GNAT family N-acyltransferase [Gordonia sp. i37]|uniref:GNAT family N-acetyltransferase n=1 Tax=Gordonia sp. i37 TaxID=1961707 RepID=UPI0009AECF0C|nr:GNAT family N-acyltransferase [Gordonia sp. i37]OPX14510.1 hemolysin [Gordonia sp. i37]